MTGTALLEVDTWVAQCREDKRLAHMHLLDMSAAFNIIPKEVLIPKLWSIKGVLSTDLLLQMQSKLIVMCLTYWMS